MEKAERLNPEYVEEIRRTVSQALEQLGQDGDERRERDRALFGELRRSPVLSEPHREAIQRWEERVFLSGWLLGIKAAVGHLLGQESNADRLVMQIVDAIDGRSVIGDKNVKNT